MPQGLIDSPRQFEWEEARTILADAANGADDGDLFVEETRSESLVWDDQRLKSASFDSVQGFGLRVVSGETMGLGFSSELTAPALRRAAEAAKSAKRAEAVSP